MARQHVPKSMSFPYQLSYQHITGGKTSRKKNVDLYYSSQGAIFYPPRASLDPTKVGKKPCWLQQQFHYCGQSLLNRIIVDNLIASLPQLLSF